MQIKAKPQISRPSLYAASGAGILLAAFLFQSTNIFANGPETSIATSASIEVSGPTIAQESEDEGEVAPEQVEKYIAVYKAMQRNHSLTIDQAAAQQGLSVPEFRDIEGKIERDDLIRERVRQALRNKSETAASPAGEPKAH